MQQRAEADRPLALAARLPQRADAGHLEKRPPLCYGVSTMDNRSPRKSLRPARNPSKTRRYARLPRPRILRLAEADRTATIMIGPLRGPAHLELIRREGYYHVPVSAIAAHRCSVHTIAFYEAASRFGGSAAIRHFAEVRRVSQVPRRSLPGLTWPGRRGEETLYYRFDLGPVLALPQPITNPDRRRVVFRFSDLDRLRQAGTLRDLGRAPKSDGP